MQESGVLSDYMYREEKTEKDHIELDICSVQCILWLYVAITTYFQSGEITTLCNLPLLCKAAAN